MPTNYGTLAHNSTGNCNVCSPALSTPQPVKRGQRSGGGSSPATLSWRPTPCPCHLTANT
eukprot:2945162-Lingulodinium_polyedra.AAC.1